MQIRPATLRTTPAGERSTGNVETPVGRLAVGLFLCFLAFYLATSGGHTITIDGEYYFRTAESLALRHSFAIEIVSPGDEGKFALRAPDGQVFGKFAPLQSVAEAPVYLLLRLPLAGYLGGGQALEQALRVWVPLVATAAISAGLVALTAVAVLALGYSRRNGLAVALVLGLGTLVWQYGRSDFSEPLQALLLLGAFLSLRRVGLPGARFDGALCGLLLGLLVLAKAINLLVLPIFGLALLWKLRAAPRRTLLIQALAFGLAALVGVIAFCLLNQARTGNPMNFGYDEPFDMPLLLGLYGWTISPGKGVFLYMPVLLAAVAAARPFAYRHGFEATVIAATTALLVFFYARFWAWSGDWAWGTRFAVVLLPLWILPLATAVSEWRVVGKALLGAAIAASLAVQILGVAVDPMAYLAYYHMEVSPLYGEPAGYSWTKESLTQIHFAPELSPILEHARMLLATLGAHSANASAASPAPAPPGRQTRVAFVEPPTLARALGITRWLPTPSGTLLGLDPWPLRSPPSRAGLEALASLGVVLAFGALLIGLDQVSARQTR